MGACNRKIIWFIVYIMERKPWIFLAFCLFSAGSVAFSLWLLMRLKRIETQDPKQLRAEWRRVEGEWNEQYEKMNQLASRLYQRERRQREKQESGEGGSPLTPGGPPLDREAALAAIMRTSLGVPNNR